MNHTKNTVAVIGAGLAGLTAAHALRRRGVPVMLYEAGEKIAGLASSFRDEEGFTYDFGAHFITNRLAAAVGVGARCRTVRRYGEAVFLRGRAYGYQFGLMRVPRFAANALATRAAALRGGHEPQSAANWFRGKYGRALADEVALPIVEAWSGADAEELAPSVGASIPGNIGRTVMLTLARRLTRREMPERASVWHVYPEGGVATLCQHLAAGLEQDVVRLGSPVKAILTEADKVAAVRVDGREQPVAAVISTAPVSALGKLVCGTDRLAHLTRFRYRPMVFVNMRFEGRGLLPDVVTWTPEKEFPIFRPMETPLSMPWLAPAGKTLLTVDIGGEKGDEFWAMDDERLGEICLEHLKAIIPGARGRYRGCRVLRTPIAYPIFLREYEEERLRFAESAGIVGLDSVGRNGEFDHVFMEDVYWRTLSKARRLAASLELTADRNPTAELFSARSLQPSAK